MSEPIKVGDLVVVVRGRWCCGHSTGREGHIFTVTEIGRAPHKEICRFCSREDIEPGAKGHPCGKGIDLYSLKRIPPLSELEGEKREEEIRA
jgi:hypothetical protein